MDFDRKHNKWLSVILYCLFLIFPAADLQISCCTANNEGTQAGCTESTVEQVPKSGSNSNSSEWCPGVPIPLGNDVTEFDFSDSKISALRPDFSEEYPNVRIIRMDNCNIKILVSNAFCRTEDNSRLEHISLKNDGIETLDKNAFEGLTSLTYLYLGENRIASLPAKIFSSLVKLTELWLKNNKISRIGAEHFSSTVSLEKLDLSSNLIEEIETFPASLLPLKELNLKNNKITKLDPNLLQNLKNLISIDLSNNMLSKIDETFFHSNPNIISISLQNNRLKYIPRKTFQNLCKLGRLDINNNNLTIPYFEWFSNVVYQSKVFQTMTYPVSSGNNWACDCRAASYIDLVVGTCYDPFYSENGLFEYLNIECSPGNRIVEKDPESCRRKIKCNFDGKKMLIKGLSCDPMCNFLTETCGGNLKYEEPQIAHFVSQKSNEKVFSPLVAFGGIIVFIMFTGLMFYVRNKRKDVRKRLNSELSTVTFEERNTDEESNASLIELSGYDNVRPQSPPPRPLPEGASVHSTPLLRRPPNHEYDLVYDGNRHSTIPKRLISPGGESNTIPKYTYRSSHSPNVGNNLTQSSQNEENPYTPMHDIVQSTGRTTIYENTHSISPNTTSYRSEHTYQSIPNTSNGYEMPI